MNDSFSDSTSNDEVLPDPISIQDATNDCRKRLQQCIDSGSPSLEPWAEDRLADFNLWDSGVGASSTKASLEVRLEPKPHLRSLVLNLLILYEISIHGCLDLGNLRFPC